MSITIRRDGGHRGGGKKGAADRAADARARSRWVWWLALALVAAGACVVAAWIKGGPVQMREQAIELSARQVGVNGQVGR